LAKAKKKMDHPILNHDSHISSAKWFIDCKVEDIKEKRDVIILHKTRKIRLTYFFHRNEDVGSAVTFDS
jgi:hypothetical protein